MNPRRAYFREYKDERYQTLKAAGLCVRCKAEPVPGRSHCRRCLDRGAAKVFSTTPERRARRRKYAAEWMKKRREGWTAAGLCIACGGKRDSNVKRCRACRDRQAHYVKRPGPPRQCSFCHHEGHNRTRCQVMEVAQRLREAQERKARLMELAGSRGAE